MSHTAYAWASIAVSMLAIAISAWAILTCRAANRRRKP